MTVDGGKQEACIGTFADLSAIPITEFQSMAAVKDPKEREKFLQRHNLHKWSAEDYTKIAPMSSVEQLIPIAVFLFGVPGAVFSIPVAIVVIGALVGDMKSTWMVAALLFAGLTVLPAPFTEASLSSRVCILLLRYFSFKCSAEEPLAPNKPYILVAPPHGVFPFGNIITMIAFPSVMGYSMRGLASSFALRAPIFKHLLCTIGVIDASREVATKALRENHTIGISTGGVAEIFETNSATGDEVIVLESRKGLVKLAIRTGASIVPCYLFGQTKLYGLWCGGENGSFLHSTLKKLSRKMGAALIFFWGRFLLPIPYRVPIVGVMSKPIAVEQCEEPSDEEVDRVHALLKEEMVKLFDRHKAKYGWADKHLIIQ